MGKGRLKTTPTVPTAKQKIKSAGILAGLIFFGAGKASLEKVIS